MRWHICVKRDTTAVFLDALKRWIRSCSMRAEDHACCLVGHSLVTGRLSSMSQQVSHAMDDMFKAFKRQIDRSAAGGVSHSASTFLGNLERVKLRIDQEIWKQDPFVAAALMSLQGLANVKHVKSSTGLNSNHLCESVEALSDELRCATIHSRQCCG